MAVYYINRNPESKSAHIIHKTRCKLMPTEANRILLGDFLTCFDALRVAIRIYPIVNGCNNCCPECHKNSNDKDY